MKIKDNFKNLEQHESPLKYGPLNLNPASIQLSEVINKLLRSEETEFSFSKECGLELDIGDEHYNVSLLLEAADLNHLDIDREAMDQYPAILSANPDYQQPELPDIEETPTEQQFRDRDVDGEFAEASYAEILAINIYTTNFYNKINPFLRGDMSEIAVANRKNNLNNKAKELLLASCLAASGLNRNHRATLISEESFRGDTDLPLNILNERIEAARTGGVSQLDAFTSSSVDEISDDFKGGAYTKFYNLYGKNVANISALPEEREYLIPPTQMQWIASKMDDETGVVYLLGRPVSSPDYVPVYAKDPRVLDVYTEFKSLKNIYSDVESKLKRRINEKRFGADERWQDHVKSMLGEYEYRINMLQKFVHKSLGFKADELDKKVKEYLDTAESLHNIDEILVLDRGIGLHELQAAILAKTNRFSWFRFDKKLLAAKNRLLLDVHKEVAALIKGGGATSEDFIRLSKLINEKIIENQKLVDDTNKHRIFFKASVGRTDKTLRIALQNLHVFEPSIDPGPEVPKDSVDYVELTEEAVSDSKPQVRNSNQEKILSAIGGKESEVKDSPQPKAETISEPAPESPSERPANSSF